tara:strand:- start:208 stop:342 length:135 start_codon:yes stop_codon:yes gene_type:complete
MDDIQNELKKVHKKLDDIKKRQEMITKIQNLERDHQEKFGQRPR